MLSNVDKRLKQIFRTTESFGGIPVIVFGDLKQIPPVKDSPVFRSGNDNYAVLVGPILWHQFKFYELTEIMRQRDDQAFAVALNNMSEGIMTAADIALLKSRIVNAKDIPQSAIQLFSTNEDTTNERP